MDRKELFHNICRDISGEYVEIGTCLGYFADFLLDFTFCSKLSCVDPYKKFEMNEYFDSLNTITQEQMDTKFIDVQNRLVSKHGNKVLMLREISTDAVKRFEDNSLAFVYIDGNHMYDAVLKDLEAWFPKIQDGGVLAGNDVEDINLPHNEDGNLLINHDENNYSLCGVHKALIDFNAMNPKFQYKVDGTQFYCYKWL